MATKEVMELQALLTVGSLKNRQVCVFDFVYALKRDCIGRRFPDGKRLYTGFDLGRHL